jgi:AraC family transcriptional regulator
MNPVQKALWFVESHSRDPITLEDIAKACNVSAFHLTRAFAATMGLSLMRYVRSRRLSEAARQLAQGADDILSVAIHVGYGSHEAFTRAFREQFALTPEQVRAQGHLNNISMTEAIVMNTTSITTLAEPRFETLEPKFFSGLVERYNCQSPVGIPDQWQRFTPYLGNIPKQLGEVAYGVCYNFDQDGNFDYMCGVEVKDAIDLPKEFKSLPVSAQKYVVFRHKEHISSLGATLTAIWEQWFPTSGYQAAAAPTFERYGPEFNGVTGTGGLEIWISIEG